MGYDLRVRIGEELMAFGAQALFQLDVVLDYAVVDYDHVARPVGMGVPFGRRAVGGPPRVGEAQAPLEAAVADLPKLLDFAFLAGDLDLAVARDCHPGRIVAPVFKPS